MKKISLYPTLLFIFIFIANFSFAQEAIIGSGGEGVNAGGSFSYTFGQFAYETYYGSGNFVVQGIQHPFEIIWLESDLSLVDTLVENGSLTCFNALATIIVAGNDNRVIIENLAVADFIAGESIRFLPGFHAQTGSQVHGYISTDGIFCSSIIQSSIVAAPQQVKEVKITEEVNNNAMGPVEMQVKIYPNPNNGVFTIDLINFEDKASISIYDLTGSVFYESKIEPTTNRAFNFSFLRKGIYFVKIISNNKQFAKKIFVN